MLDFGESLKEGGVEGTLSEASEGVCSSQALPPRLDLRVPHLTFQGLRDLICPVRGRTA